MRTRPGSGEFESLTRSALTGVTFIQVARTATFLGGHLTLMDLEPTTIWLADDSGLRIGHMATGTFLDLWRHPESGLAGAGLRGLLGRADPDAQLLGDAVLRLRDPRISGSGLRYDAVLVNGFIAGASGACVLFLGPGDAPDAPGVAHSPSASRSAPRRLTSREPWRV